MRWLTRLLKAQSYNIHEPHYGPGVDSASNRNEYQESSWGVKSGREPQPLTTLRASKACRGENFTFYPKTTPENYV
jgi:hypothetical protein